ncbi:MAG: hypothetical protein ACO1SV_03265 [Fimbriimonas sp.]
MRAATSAALAVLAVAAHAQAFGRFGYVETTRFSGLTLGKDGLAADHPTADRLRFTAPVPEWRPIETSEFDQTVRLGPDEEGLPSKLKLSLLTPGVSVYFPKGMRFRLGSTAAPYLTWSDGSASNAVPTPGVRWIALSFRDAQPALLLGFPSGTASLLIKGQPGAWEVSAEAYSGWVRVALPRGGVAEPTNSAAALGRLAKTAAASATLLASPVPQFTGFSAEAEPDGNGVVATWSFDRSGFVLPQALTLARLGGYPVGVLSPIRRIAGSFGLGIGPHEQSDAQNLKVRFPIRRVPIGRALALGEPGPPIGTVSPQDIPSVAELALENLLGSRDGQTRKAAEDAFAQFLSEATYVKETATEQQLTFDAAGVGIDTTAGHALLSQALISTKRPSSESNALLTSIGWRRDWKTWLPWVENEDLRRRSAALAAIAGALCPEPNRRVAAGMLQAGLAAERGLNIWRRRAAQIPSEPPLLEPLLELRAGLFRLTTPKAVADPFVETILSPLRVFSDEAATLTDREGKLIMSWPVVEAKAGTLALASTAPIEPAAVANLPRFIFERVLGLTEVRYTPEAAGACEASLGQPTWAPRPPKLNLAPRYSEPRK